MEKQFNGKNILKMEMQRNQKVKQILKNQMMF